MPAVSRLCRRRWLCASALQVDSQSHWRTTHDNATLLPLSCHRLWVDDHLVLDDTPAAGQTEPRTVASWILLPAFSTPRPFRLEYTRLFALSSSSSSSPSSSSAASSSSRSNNGDANTSPGVLSLQWDVPSQQERPGVAAAAAAATAAANAPVVVPTGAFSSDVSPVRQQLNALRQRLFEPQVPWQTYLATSMAAHTLQPTGLVVRATLVDLNTVRACVPACLCACVRACSCVK